MGFESSSCGYRRETLKDDNDDYNDDRGPSLAR
jgi:hypothetical protein